MKIRSTKMGTATLALGVVLLAGCQGTTDTAASPPATTDSSSTATDSDSTPEASADNGVADLPAVEILKRAEAALDKAGSFHVAGKAPGDNPPAFYAPSNVDVGVAGTELRGSMTLFDAKVYLLVVGDYRYIRSPGYEFWAGMNSAPWDDKKWIRWRTDEDDFKSVFDYVDLHYLFPSSGRLTKGAAKTVRGVPAIAIVNRATHRTLYVSTTDEPYPLELTDTAGSVLTFDRFGEEVTGIKKPPASAISTLQDIGE